MNVDELFLALEKSLTQKNKTSFKGTGGTDSLQILRRLKSEVNSELSQSRKVTRAKADILKSADESARKIIEEANRRTNDALNETDYVLQAQKKAEEILKAAVMKQSEIMRNFALYLDSKLCDCEKLLSGIAEDIRADRAKLFPQ